MVLPDFAQVKKACHDLLFEHSSTAPPLYSLDLKLKTVEPGILSTYYTDKKILKNIQIVLRYIFTYAHTQRFPIHHDNGTLLDNRAIINKVIVYFCRISPKSIEGKRNAGITHQSQMAISNSIILGRFLAQKSQGEKTEGLLDDARMADDALVGFMLNACNQSENGEFYDPGRDKSLKKAWKKVFRYLDRFITWKSKSRHTKPMVEGNEDAQPAYVTMIKSIITLINQTHDDAMLIPSNLVQRMECCAAILESTTPKKDVKYPPGSTMSMKHPCDAYLRSIMGHPVLLDLRMFSIHEKLSKECEGYQESRVDPLTNFITSRRYNTSLLSGEYEPDRKPTFLGGIPFNTNEALIHAMCVGGKATMSSGYDPLSKSTLPLVAANPCKWFPVLQGGMMDALEHAYWNMVQDAVDSRLYGLVESAIVIIRFNFTCAFNSYEKELSKKMLHPSWCGVKSEDDLGRLRDFSNACKEFMRGPAITCCNRLKCGHQVLDMWMEAETSIMEYMKDISRNSPGQIVMGVLECMNRCSIVAKNAADTYRHNNLKSILSVNGGFVPTLRLLMFSRLSTKIEDPNHPFKVFLDNNKLSLTNHAGMFSSKDSCREFVLASEDMGASLLPLTKQWISTETSVENRICKWIFDEMFYQKEILVPETMAPSLPFLDKICVISALACAFLDTLVDGLPVGEVSWALFETGIDLEMYEWDDTFVQRLTSNSMGAGVPREAVKGYVMSILMSCMTGCETPRIQEGFGVDEVDLARFDGILRNVHYHEMKSWFEKHMQVYGVFYQVLRGLDA